MIGKVIHNLLSNNATVTSLVGSKIYPIIVPQNTLFPAITYERVGTDGMEVKGYQKIADKIFIQINVFSDSYENLTVISEAIKNTLNYQHGFTNQSIDVCYIIPTDESDGQFDFDLKLFHRILRFEISVNLPYTL